MVNFLLPEVLILTLSWAMLGVANSANGAISAGPLNLCARLRGSCWIVDRMKSYKSMYEYIRMDIYMDECIWMNVYRNQGGCHQVYSSSSLSLSGRTMSIHPPPENETALGPRASKPWSS